MNSPLSQDSSADPQPVHRRRVRYSGKYPRKFEDKYKEHNASAHPDTAAKVLASGKTLAGSHRPIMVAEILEALRLSAGEVGVDCTLGHGGHAQAMLDQIGESGRLLGIDADPIEIAKTEERLRSLGYSPARFQAFRSSFAGLHKVLHEAGLTRVDFLLADLGLSSMQIDNPERGFSVKFDGPLDMRMNPDKGAPASLWLSRVSESALERVLRENSDEPQSALLANQLAGKHFARTKELGDEIRRLFPNHPKPELGLTIRRVFQAIRIEVNDELGALDQWLRIVPECLNPGGRVAVLTFHSGEDRRVKKAFQAGLAAGHYSSIAPEVIRPTEEERHGNPRSGAAKLRWAMAGARSLQSQVDLPVPAQG